MKKLLLVSIALLVLLACGLQLAGSCYNKDLATVNLIALKNFQALGWRKTEIPVGESPEMLQAVEQILAYDDVVSWNLESHGRDIQVYIAYWHAGKRSAKEVAMHTPDNCWVSAGWQMKERGTRDWIVGDSELKSAQDRVFSIHGTERSVFFWHVFGDRIISYAKEKPTFRDGLKDFWRDGLNSRKEQVFVRISSSYPMEKVKDWDAFQHLLMTLKNAIPALELSHGSEFVPKSD